MKRGYIVKVCNGLSIIFVVIFVIKCIADYSRYDAMVNSAPFDLWIIVNAIQLLIPALILFVIAKVIEKKN